MLVVVGGGVGGGGCLVGWLLAWDSIAFWYSKYSSC